MGKTVKDRSYSFNHTKQRLSERYGIDINQDHYDILCDNIKNNKGVVLVMIEKQKNDTKYTNDQLVDIFKKKVEKLHANHFERMIPSRWKVKNV